MAEPATAGTKTSNGTKSHASQEPTMNLGNGNTVFGGHSEGVATIPTDPPTLGAAKCMGTGRITRTSIREDGGSFSYQLTITMP